MLIEKEVIYIFHYPTVKRKTSLCFVGNHFGKKKQKITFNKKDRLTVC